MYWMSGSGSLGGFDRNLEPQAGGLPRNYMAQQSAPGTCNRAQSDHEQEGSFPKP